jgi:lycopene beta-cyclase
MPLKDRYDYIVTGGGCAGLSFILHVLQTPSLSNKSILLIEKEQNRTNDRTWCYWEKSSGFFEEIVFRKWDMAWFHGLGYGALKQLGPYAYKMIRGIDFYNHCYDRIAQSGRVDLLHEKVNGIENTDDGVVVRAGNEIFRGDFAFNSILFEQPILKDKTIYLLQHFKGWIIETKEPVFDPEKPTLMDFRVGQDEGTTFVYVMPFSATRALVEFTLFTPKLLEQESYDQGLKDYLRDFLKLEEYTVVEEEFGVIPMTDHVFPAINGNIVHLGTAGGQTKPSTGYTFRFIQKHVAAVVDQLAVSGNPFLAKLVLQKRFMWYDRVLLHMLFHKKMPGARIFTLLFSRNPIQRIFRFLDNETKLKEELILMNTLPQWPFMKAGWKELFK